MPGYPPPAPRWSTATCSAGSTTTSSPTSCGGARCRRWLGRSSTRRAVVLVEDQWLASAPGASTGSPWHQDAPYYNIAGEFLTLWLALDAAGPDAALRVVEGSHRGPIFAPVEFATTRTTIGEDRSELREPPPVDPEADGATVLRWSVAPGDVVVLHSGVLHAAGGAPVADRWFRRLSVRYARPSARYLDRGPTAASFWRSLPHGLRDGDPLACATFPLIDERPRTGGEAIAGRP